MNSYDERASAELVALLMQRRVIFARMTPVNRPSTDDTVPIPVSPGTSPSRWGSATKTIGSAAVIFLVLAGVALGSRSHNGATVTRPIAGVQPERKASDEPLRVNTIVVQAAQLDESVMATGTLRAAESVDLQAEVSGKIVSINFREGSRVKKGEILVKVNDSELVASLARARARLQLALQREARFSQLAVVGGINEQDVDTVRSELAVQKAEVELIEAQITKTELRAPFDGIVGLRFVSEGAFLTATSNNAVRIATLQSIDSLKIDFSISEKYVSRVTVGVPVEFLVAGYKDRFRGEVYAYEPRIDVATRTLLIRAVCPNTGSALLPGAFATVEVKLGQVNDAIVVPASAVIAGLSEKNVFLIKEGRAVRRGVQTGTRTESAVQIVSGLEPGDVLITSGLQQLRNGQAVRSGSESHALIRSAQIVELNSSSRFAALLSK
jgi:membrane fusion protein (multidrug efflux system)